MKHFHSILTSTFMAAVLSAGCSPKVTSKPESAVPTITVAETPYVSVRTDVPNKAFYKDVFMHGGLHLSSYPDMPCLSVIGLSHEYISLDKATRENRDIENSIFNHNDVDANGVLLYPDGEPRFRMIYVNGGGANTSGRKLEYEGRRNFKEFVDNGGNYVGSCAGAYLASEAEDWTAFDGYVGVWPGNCSGALSPRWSVGYIIPEASPLRKYSDFGGDFYVDSVLHHNGPYFERWAETPGTEVLAINAYPAYKFHGHPSVIAYKANCYKGRVIPIGGHPEIIESGEGLELMADIVRYALEGQGCAKAKGVLSNGEIRRMTKATEDDDPAHTKIGDKQCHHFVFALPKKARNIVIRLESLENYELSLRLANGTFAFKEDAQYAKEGKELVKELKFDELEAGTWYIGIQCESTVETKELETHVEYSNTGILNGAPYTISVKWDNVSIGKAILDRGGDVNEIIKQSIHPKMLASEKDSVIIRIVLQTASSSTEGVRVDDKRISEAPVYAVVKDGILTLSTPADQIWTGQEGAFLFSGLTQLKAIENIQALNTSNAKYLGEMFKGCASLESLDLSSFRGDKLISIDGMFYGCKKLSKVDLSSCASANKVKMGDAFRMMPALSEINLGQLKYNDFELYGNIYLFASPKDSADRRTCSATKSLTIKCTPEVATGLVKSNLSNLHNGKNNAQPVEIHFIDAISGKEFTPEWK